MGPVASWESWVVRRRRRERDSEDGDVEGSRTFRDVEVSVDCPEEGGGANEGERGVGGDSGGCEWFCSLRDEKEGKDEVSSSCFSPLQPLASKDLRTKAHPPIE